MVLQAKMRAGWRGFNQNARCIPTRMFAPCRARFRATGEAGGSNLKSRGEHAQEWTHVRNEVS